MKVLVVLLGALLFSCVPARALPSKKGCISAETAYEQLRLVEQSMRRFHLPSKLISCTLGRARARANSGECVESVITGTEIVECRRMLSRCVTRREAIAFAREWANGHRPTVSERGTTCLLDVVGGAMQQRHCVKRFDVIVLLNRNLYQGRCAFGVQ